MLFGKGEAMTDVMLPAVLAAPTKTKRIVLSIGWVKLLGAACLVQGTLATGFGKSWKSTRAKHPWRRRRGVSRCEGKSVG
jgi:hypothetical protein